MSNNKLECIDCKVEFELLARGRKPLRCPECRTTRPAKVETFKLTDAQYAMGKREFYANRGIDPESLAAIGIDADKQYRASATFRDYLAACKGAWTDQRIVDLGVDVAAQANGLIGSTAVDAFITALSPELLDKIAAYAGPGRNGTDW